jgi:hypothetical protein
MLLAISCHTTLFWAGNAIKRINSGTLSTAPSALTSVVKAHWLSTFFANTIPEMVLHIVAVVVILAPRQRRMSHLQQLVVDVAAKSLRIRYKNGSQRQAGTYERLRIARGCRFLTVKVT